VALSGLVTSPYDTGKDDFTAYWSAGRLNAAGQDPYDPGQVLRTERMIGWAPARPLMIYCPPSTLPLVMLVGWMSYAVARRVWLILQIGVTLCCAHCLWQHYRGPPRLRWLAPLLALVFFPVIASLMVGQLGPTLLLGLVGFQHYARRDQWWQAGVCLALLALKPQLVPVLWVAVLLWAVAKRRWPVLLACCAALATWTGIAAALNPRVLGQYVRYALSSPPSEWVTPTLGAMLRQIFGPEKYWLQFVPPVAGVVWLAFYWRGHRGSWDWDAELPPLLLVSLLTSPFAWIHDYVVLLVVLIQAAAVPLSNGRTGVAIWSAVGYELISALALAWAILDLGPPLAAFSGWVAPAFLIWYLVARRAMAAQSAPRAASAELV
jgi:hypothetical protein